MDRNTLTGLVLIGLVLTIFSIINQPSEEDLKKAKIEAANKAPSQDAKKIEMQKIFLGEKGKKNTAITNGDLKALADKHPHTKKRTKTILFFMIINFYGMPLLLHQHSAREISPQVWTSHR